MVLIYAPNRRTSSNFVDIALVNINSIFLMEDGALVHKKSTNSTSKTNSLYKFIKLEFYRKHVENY